MEKSNSLTKWLSSGGSNSKTISLSPQRPNTLPSTTITPSATVEIQTGSSILVSDPSLNLTKNSEMFNHMHRNGKHYIQCIPCNKYPDIVKKH